MHEVRGSRFPIKLMEDCLIGMIPTTSSHISCMVPNILLSLNCNLAKYLCLFYTRTDDPDLIWENVYRYLEEVYIDWDQHGQE